ncbi:MAG: Fic family protein [Polyangiaceae bacterium]|nr:Fic family protein [Polyangiaceae bacterium]
MRPYERTHPWISFQLNLGEIPFEIWLLLGEARSKAEHLAGVPLTPATATKLHKLYLAKGVHATTAIEGNTLSAEDVQRQIDGKLHVPPSKEYLRRETANILAAVNDIFDAACLGPTAPPTTVDFCEFNRRVLEGLSHERVEPGVVRKFPVVVANYKAPEHGDCTYLLGRLAQWLAELQAQAPPAMGMAMPILRAILAHLYMAWIHPFGDGNGRTARLLEFSILVSAGMPTPAAHLLSNHYNETRSEYYRQLARASEQRTVLGFVQYALRGFVDALRAQIADVRQQTMSVVWVNYVHDQFRDLDSKTARRRKELVLALTRSGETLPRRVRELSPKLAAEYATKTQRTVDRDIAGLKTMGLIVEEDGKVRSRTEAVLAFLPRKATDAEGVTVQAE